MSRRPGALALYLGARRPPRPNSPALSVKFDPRELGVIEVTAGGEPPRARLVGHTGWAHEVAGWVLKLEDPCFHPLGEYLSDDGWGDLDGVLVGYIRNLRVEPELRGRGLGSAMVARALEAMREGGIRRVFLHPSPDPPERMGDLVRFYEELGFRDFDGVSGGCPVLVWRPRSRG